MERTAGDEFLLGMLIPLIAGSALIVLAWTIMPENCAFFVDNVPGPQSCHTVGAVCREQCRELGTAYFASTLAGLGIATFITGFFINSFLNRREDRNPGIFSGQL